MAQQDEAAEVNTIPIKVAMQENEVKNEAENQGENQGCHAGE